MSQELAQRAAPAVLVAEAGFFAQKRGVGEGEFSPLRNQSQVDLHPRLTGTYVAAQPAPGHDQPLGLAHSKPLLIVHQYGKYLIRRRQCQAALAQARSVFDQLEVGNVTHTRSPLTRRRPVFESSPYGEVSGAETQTGRTRWSDGTPDEISTN